jgi:ABC-type transporter MlaC component
MDTASFSGILRTLFIIVLVYYAVRFFLKLFAPALVQHVVKKAGENLYEQQQRQQQQYNQQQANTAKERPAEKKKVGEYIDFEEID